MRNEVLRLEKVTLRERGVTQLDNLNLHIFEGEILGLVPIDTHGLTALCDLLRENLPLHYGYVFYREKLINTWRSPQPHYNRISIIQAKSCLVDGLSVADNIFVLRPGFRGRLMRPAAFRRQLAPFIRSAGIPIDADARVEDLSVFERFVVELLKAVVAGSRLIVLNEISTLINEAELGKLAGVDDDKYIIAPNVFGDIQSLKGDILNHDRTSLNLEETLTALCISAERSESAERTFEMIGQLKGCRAHCTAILSDRDEQTLRSMGIDVTCDPEYVTTNLYFA